jgi:hypothetical protein
MGLGMDPLSCMVSLRSKDPSLCLMGHAHGLFVKKKSKIILDYALKLLGGGRKLELQ